MSAPSMPCTEVRQRLTAFLDGEIAGEECWSIRRHLEECPPCEQSAQLERNFTNVLRDRLERESAPAGLAARVREALAGRPESSRSRTGRDDRTIRRREWGSDSSFSREWPEPDVRWQGFCSLSGLGAETGGRRA